MSILKFAVAWWNLQKSSIRTENARISFEVKDEEAPIAVEKKTEREKKEKHTMIEYYTSPKQGW